MKKTTNLIANGRQRLADCRGRQKGLLGLVAVLWLASSSWAADVRGWRNDGTGVFPDADPPTSWGPGKNEVWSTVLGDKGIGNASPVLIGDRLLTAVDPFILVCLRASDGTVLWKTSHDLWTEVLSREEAESAKKLAAEATAYKKEVSRLEHVASEAGRNALDRLMKPEYAKMTPEERAALVAQTKATLADMLQNPPAGLKWVNEGMTHQFNGPASATPVTDGKYVYYVFGNGLAICCDINTGKRVWYNKLTGEIRYEHHGSAGASPVLAGDRVIMRFGLWTYCLDVRDGAVQWEKRDPKNASLGYGSPTVVDIGGTLVVFTAHGQFFRVSDGVMLADLDIWSNKEQVPTPVVHQGVVFFAVNDRKTTSSFQPQPQAAHLLAVQLPDRLSGDKLEIKTLWKTETPSGRVGASPVVCNGLLFIRDYMGSMLRVFDIRDGNLVYEKDMDDYINDGSNSTAYSSLSAGGGNIYINSSRHDRTLIIKASREYVEVARNTRGLDIPERTGWTRAFGLIYRPTPVFSGTRMYWREGNTMYCFAKDAASKP